HVHALFIDGRAILDRDFLGGNLVGGYAVHLDVLGHADRDIGAVTGDLDVVAIDELHGIAGPDLARGIAVGLDVPALVGDIAHVVDVCLHAVERIVDVVVGVSAHIQFRHQLAIDEGGVSAHAFGNAVA